MNQLEAQQLDFYDKIRYCLFVNKQLNLPNTLSVIRICMAPIIFFLIVFHSERVHVFLIVLYILTVILDFFDGYFARLFSLETELGKILDPLADKLLVLLILLALISVSNFPIWLAILIVLRDILIIIASSIIYRSNNVIRPSIIIGKVTFFMISLLFLLYIIDMDMNSIGILKEFFCVSSFGFLIWSFLDYYKVYKRIRNG